MSLVEFQLPEELRNVTADEFCRQMLARIPREIDTTEGSFAFDMLKPPALLAAELVQFWLVLGLQNSFHMWATGSWLDACAADCGLSRRAATFAYGNVHVTADPFLTFPKGFVFSVPSENGEPALDFETVEKSTVPESGQLSVRVKASKSGVTANVRSDTITIMKTPVDNVYLITNDATSGGTEIESDDSLRARIDDYYAGRQASFVGNKRDYIRWAKMVDGVGCAQCIPLYDGANSVKLVISDANGQPAAQEILDAVATFIFGENHDDLNRLAPVGVAKWAVEAPIMTPVNYSLDVKISSDLTLETVEENIRAKLDSFYRTLADDENRFGTLRYVKVSEQILNTAGVEDFKHLRVNGALSNVEFAADELPITGTIELTRYG